MIRDYTTRLRALGVETQLQLSLGLMLGGSLLAGAALAVDGWLAVPAAIALLGALWLIVIARDGLDTQAAALRRVQGMEARFDTLAKAVADMQRVTEDCRRGFGHSTYGTAGASLRVSDAVGTLDRIAFQTHLMALNIAVQASRANQAGRAYADVARELIKQARDASAAAREAATTLRDCKRLLDEGSTATLQSEIRLDAVLEQVNSLRFALATLGIEVPVPELQPDRSVLAMDIAEPAPERAALQAAIAAATALHRDKASAPDTPAPADSAAQQPGMPGFVERRSPDSPGARLRAGPGPVTGSGTDPDLSPSPSPEYPAR